MAEYIYTVSKKQFYPLNPRLEDVDIRDIAHALSMLSRANGHFPSFHSVAQHSIECANEAAARGLSPKLCLGCLLHDASEAYMSDVTTPVKNNLEDYRKYEDNLINVIYEKYAGVFSDEEKEIIYGIDKDLLYYEFYHYMGIELSKKPEICSNPVFEERLFAEVRDEYLRIFEGLTAKLLENEKVTHPFLPLFNEDSHVLILGSFPSVKSREEKFFYGHPQNRFWKVIANVFGEKVPETTAQKKEIILKNNLALWDVIASCEIEGSSDSSIRNVVANDLNVIFNRCSIDRIYVNGKTAEKYYNKYIRDIAGKNAVCLPSTSPANAAWSFEKLCEAWKEVKK